MDVIFDVISVAQHLCPWCENLKYFLLDLYLKTLLKTQRIGAKFDIEQTVCFFKLIARAFRKR